MTITQMTAFRSVAAASTGRCGVDSNEMKPRYRETPNNSSRTKRLHCSCCSCRCVSAIRNELTNQSTQSTFSSNHHIIKPPHR